MKSIGKKQQMITRNDSVGQPVPNNKQEKVKVDLQKVVWGVFPSRGHGKHLPCVQVLSLLSLLMFTAVVSLTCWSTCPGDPRERQGWAGRFTGAQVAWLLTGAPGCHTATSLCINAVPLWVCSGKSIPAVVRAPLIAQSRSVCLKGGFGPYWVVYSCDNFICL